MGIDINDMKMIKNLVGDISVDDLKYVDSYVSKDLGIFIPSVGFCQYAIKPNHVHPSYSFVLFLSENQSIIEPTIKVTDNQYLMTAISPNVPHEEELSETFTRYIAIMISKELFENEYFVYDDIFPDKYIWKQFLVEYEIMVYIKKFMQEFDNKVLGYENLLESLGLIITNYIIRSILKVKSSTDFVSDKIEINKVVEYMHQNFGKKLSNLYLSKKVNMSESHFIRVFKKETGMSPIEYLLNLRINKAKKLLKSGSKNITEISLICGFNSQSHFSSSFIKYENVTPSEYQNIYMNK